MALKSTYGYEWQGDNLLIARENVLQTMDDFYKDFCANKLKLKSKQALTDEQLEYFAVIVSWNIWQMDGLKYTIPLSGEPTPVAYVDKRQAILPLDIVNAGQKEAKDNEVKSGIYAKIKDWDAGKTGKTIRFVDLLSK